MVQGGTKKLLRLELPPPLADRISHERRTTALLVACLQPTRWHFGPTVLDCETRHVLYWRFFPTHDTHPE
jgi:hypothetical protein